MLKLILFVVCLFVGTGVWAWAMTVEKRKRLMENTSSTDDPSTADRVTCNVGWEREP